MHNLGKGKGNDKVRVTAWIPYYLHRWFLCPNCVPLKLSEMRFDRSLTPTMHIQATHIATATQV